VSLAPLIGLTILAAGLAFAQQNLPVPTPAPPGTAAPAAGAEAGGDDEAAAAKTGEEAPAARPADAKGSPQHFEPTEKVRPDFDVAFPVDI
jgi:hypothetical protein